MVRQDNEVFKITKGDLIVFKVGLPDSNKKWERIGKRLTQEGVLVEDYWKDEENPDLFWPKSLKI